ncbi:MAG: hypothetical protein GY739_12500 [Mesoflavibacter sp.]|nr:hypothetical protein [Mesoflavibacter sp.]
MSKKYTQEGLELARWMKYGGGKEQYSHTDNPLFKVLEEYEKEQVAAAKEAEKNKGYITIKKPGGGIYRYKANVTDDEVMKKAMESGDVFGGKRTIVKSEETEHEKMDDETVNEPVPAATQEEPTHITITEDDEIMDVEPIIEKVIIPEGRYCCTKHTSPVSIILHK